MAQRQGLDTQAGLRHSGPVVLTGNWEPLIFRRRVGGGRADLGEIGHARRLIRLCHRQGIRVGGYIGDTMILETLLAEEPDAASWHHLGPDGTGIHYGGVQTFRFKWCRTNPAFMAYMKRLLAPDE